MNPPWFNQRQQWNSVTRSGTKTGQIRATLMPQTNKGRIETNENSSGRKLATVDLNWGGLVVFGGSDCVDALAQRVNLHGGVWRPCAPSRLQSNPSE
jgi:hypothetical protein